MPVALLIVALSLLASHVQAKPQICHVSGDIINGEHTLIKRVCIIDHQNQTYDQSITNCMSHGMRLMVIDSKSTLRGLTRFFQHTNPLPECRRSDWPTEECSLKADGRFSNGKWRTSVGKLYGNIEWINGTPSEGDCLSLKIDDGRIKAMSNECNETFMSLCEFDVMEELYATPKV